MDKSGNVSAEPVNITVRYDTTNWFEQDGIYYYKTPVGPNMTTDNLLQKDKHITEPTEGKPDGCHLEVTVLAESIQAAPSTAVEGAWKVVKVDNGALTPVTTTP